MFMFSLSKSPASPLPSPLASGPSLQSHVTLRDCHSWVGCGGIRCLKGRGWTCPNPTEDLASVPAQKRLFW